MNTCMRKYKEKTNYKHVISVKFFYSKKIKRKIKRKELKCVKELCDDGNPFVCITFRNINYISMKTKHKNVPRVKWWKFIVCSFELRQQFKKYRLKVKELNWKNKWLESKILWTWKYLVMCKVSAHLHNHKFFVSSVIDMKYC